MYCTVIKYSTRNQHQICKTNRNQSVLNIVLFINTHRYESTYTGTWNLNSIYHIYQEGSQMSQSYIRTRGQGGGRVLLCGCLETPLSWSHAVLFRHPTSRSSHWIESKQWSDYSLVDLGFSHVWIQLYVYIYIYAEASVHIHHYVHLPMAKLLWDCRRKDKPVSDDRNINTWTPAPS